MPRTCMVAGIAVLLLPIHTQAQDRIPGLSFSHRDWELACDNTRTCRAAGYQGDEDEHPVSVLLTRAAGPGQAVTGEIMIGNYDNAELLGNLPAVFELTMRIDDRAVGRIAVSRNSLVAKLSARQVEALLAALSRSSHIEWVAGGTRWHLSDQGAAAVLLKMDDFQGRVGTPGALIRKGTLGENVVLPPLPVPVVIAARPAAPRPTDTRFLAENLQALRQALAATIRDDDCVELQQGANSNVELSINRLTDTKMLVSTQCWLAAYNFGYGYWVVDDTPPYHPVLVTTSGSDYGDGIISASQKGRGLGDCWSSEDWTWDGGRFVHTRSASSGMCKLLAPGGAWSLPTIVTDVRHPPR